MRSSLALRVIESVPADEPKEEPQRTKPDPAIVNALAELLLADLLRKCKKKA